MRKFNLDFLFFDNPLNITIFLIWIGLLIWMIKLTNSDPPKADEIEKQNEFSYVSTLFSIFTLVNYFRYFPTDWNVNGTMKIVNVVIFFASLVSLFIIINKNKTDPDTERFKKNLIPLQGMFITLAVYSFHTGLGVIIKDISPPVIPKTPVIPNTEDYIKLM